MTDDKHLYMITISCQQKKDYIGKSDLDEVIMYLKYHVDSLHVLDHVYENSGKYKQLHWHAIAQVHKNFRYAPYSAFGARHLTNNTYIIHWSKIRSLVAAVAYLHKDLRYLSQDEIFINNYYSVNRFAEKYLI